MNAAADKPAAPHLRQLAGLGGRLRPGLGGFWQWWTRSLAAWLPQRMRHALGMSHERILLRRHAGQLERVLEQDGRMSPLPPLSWADGEMGDVLLPDINADIADLPRWLLLPPEAGLRRRLQLPAAAAPRLREVLGFEIDRQTPFTMADVHYDVRLLAREGDHIQAELVVVPSSGLQATLQGLGPLAATLAGVDMADGDGRALGVNLLPAAQRSRRRDTWRVWNVLLALLIVLAIAAAMAVLLHNRRQAAEALQAAIRKDAPMARTASAERQELSTWTEGLAHLQEERARRPTMVEVLAELSTRLPLTTYLERVSVENDQLLISGLSSDAAGLVAQLDGARTWRTPALSGALQPDPQSRRDRFTLTAALAIGPAPPAAGGADAQPSE